MSVVPSMMALIPLPLPPPETLIFTPSLAAMYFSAAAWAMGRTVVEPFMTMSAPKAMPERERIAIPARTAAVFLIAKEPPCFLSVRRRPSPADDESIGRIGNGCRTAV